jgi:hypothetical protein
VTYQETTDFWGGVPALLSTKTGSWIASNNRYQGTSQGDSGISILTTSITTATYLEFQSTVNTKNTAGLIFDYHSATDFKYATINPATKTVAIGHATPAGLVNDSTATKTIDGSVDNVLAVTVKGSNVSLYLNGVAVFTQPVIFKTTINGSFGLIARGGPSLFDDVLLRGTDPSAANGF